MERKKNHKCLGILEADTIKQAEMMETIRKENLVRTETSRTQALLQKFHQRDNKHRVNSCKILATIQ